MQIDIDLQKEFRRDKAIECSPGNDLLEFLNSEQNIWYRETKTDLGSSQHQGTEQGRIMNTKLHYYLLFILQKF